MAKRENILAKLEQNDTDQKKLREEHQRLEIELIHSEVTYSIGDRFTTTIKGNSCKSNTILVTNGKPAVVMIDLANGLRWKKTITEVKDMDVITKEEFSEICRDGTFSRYWDNAKKERVY